MDIVPADQLEQSEWYRKSRPVRRKLLEEIAEAALYRGLRTEGPHLRQAAVTDTASAMQARKMANAPLLLLLENDISDRTLVEAALRMYGKPVTLELCFGAPAKLDPPAYEPESRGGHGELKKLIARRIEEAVLRGRPPRIVVVTDSDGEWPGEVKTHAQAIREECAQANIPCPPLNKRTAENYIPDAVWRSWSAKLEHTSSRPAVEALLRLSPEQRDHVHMATPSKSPWDPMNPNAVALFRTPPVSDADRDILQQANLKGSGNTMIILSLRDYAAALTLIDLRARDHQGDLEAVVRHIEDEL